MKERLKQYNRHLRMILKSELNTKNKITGIGVLAIPVLRYSFVIINWRLEQVKNLSGELEMHHPEADIDRLYVQRKAGGWGLLQIEAI
jgi:hypothetical protein